MCVYLLDGGGGGGGKVVKGLEEGRERQRVLVARVKGKRLDRQLAEMSPTGTVAQVGDLCKFLYSVGVDMRC